MLDQFTYISLGLVRAPITTTGAQVASRIVLVWGAVFFFPSLAKSAAYSSMLFAWSVTEVIRYSYFVVTLSGYSPGFIKWLRYNTFFVLYPIGISSECWILYKAIEPARKRGEHYAWLLQFILLVYVPGELLLFSATSTSFANQRYLQDHIFFTHT